MNTMKYSVCLFVCMLFNSGCATLYTNLHPKPAVYGGTQMDCGAVFLPLMSLNETDDIGETCCLFSVIPLALLDLPFSFVADTILLPWNIVETREREREDAKRMVPPVKKKIIITDPPPKRNSKSKMTIVPAKPPGKPSAAPIGKKNKAAPD